jgi:thiamine-phosphate pyrophosphorylase
VVTDRLGHPRPLAETVQATLDGGGRWVWFRDRDLDPGARRRLGASVADRVRARGGILTVGGDVALARALDADGVHLGGDTTPEGIRAARSTLGAETLIGVSIHVAGEAARAAAAGADYVTVSPIYATASKPGYGPSLGPEGIRTALIAGLPVVALGGITPERSAACRGAGAAGLAVMGGLMRAANPEAATRLFLDAWDGRNVASNLEASARQAGSGRRQTGEGP